MPFLKASAGTPKLVQLVTGGLLFSLSAPPKVRVRCGDGSDGSPGHPVRFNDSLYLQNEFRVSVDDDEGQKGEEEHSLFSSPHPVLLREHELPCTCYYLKVKQRLFTQRKRNTCTWILHVKPDTLTEVKNLSRSRFAVILLSP